MQHFDDLPAACVAADLVALAPERIVAFSAVAVEAQAMGRPVIAADEGALPELLVAPPDPASLDRTGWLFQPHDPVDLARTLARALTLGPQSLRLIGERGRRFAEETYSPQRIVADTLSLYAWALETRAQPARNPEPAA
jgi:glycosyltransferase involved in cell wall biosynthesis